MTQIYAVGVGLSGKDSLLPETLGLINQADILVGSDRLLQLFSHYSAQQWPLGNFSDTLEKIRDYVQENPTTVVIILASGDPLFFGLGRLLLSYFTGDELTFIPNLSSVQLAFSRLKLPWQDASFVSVHGRGFDELFSLLRQGKSKIAILTDPEHSPAAIARLILSLDSPIHYQAWVCENLGAQYERVEAFDLASLQTHVFESLTLLILLRQESSREPLDASKLPLMGIPDAQFHTFRDRPGLMTKREIRLLALGELGLQSHHICWDIGSGTGAMAIEMARLASEGAVYAIEKTSAGVNLIHRNQTHFSVLNLVVSQGHAPEHLQDWPAPDRIFIGGSGGNLIKILETCQVSLSEGGRVVLAIATLENLHQALTWLASNHWQVKILNVQLSKSVPIAALTRFQPLNPVYLVTAEASELD